MWKSRCGESLRACVENRVLEGNTVWKETGLEGREADVERKIREKRFGGGRCGGKRYDRTSLETNEWNGKQMWEEQVR